ncbi:hypothetical protein EGW08_006413 [Elysia chlorotica]|uniref:Uncharacterized protein n=1 Tax=Elysia chlorotica TaxID=188477 RepID=A0A433TW32_ELYCH|nr:hypothetical protein EGW08_006413 [Elysia chlorotica]
MQFPEASSESWNPSGLDLETDGSGTECDKEVMSVDCEFVMNECDQKELSDRRLYRKPISEKELIVASHIYPNSRSSSPIYEYDYPALNKSSCENKMSVCKHAHFSKRVWDRKQMCLYSSKYFLKLSKHLPRVHYTGIEVACACAFPKNSKERKAAFKAIMNKGDFIYNQNIAKSGDGTLIAAR